MYKKKIITVDSVFFLLGRKENFMIVLAKRVQLNEGVIEISFLKRLVQWLNNTPTLKQVIRNYGEAKLCFEP